MSSKKIIRLKTPCKTRDNKSPESTFATHINYNELDTIMKVQNIQYSESLQLTLVNEINKLYKEIEILKNKFNEEKQITLELSREKKHLRGRIQIVERQYYMYKDMYQLERDNHERLRKFYQQREVQWVLIVKQHKKMLQYFDSRNGTCLADFTNEQKYAENSQTKYNNIIGADHLRANNNQNTKQTKINIQNAISQRNKSRGKNSLSQSKYKTSKIEKAQLYYHKQINRLYKQESQFSNKSQLMYQSIKKDSERKSINLKNPEIDEIVDKIMRKTYYKYKQSSITIKQIEEMEDMIKLKNAKSSTRQRLSKTIKKLEFQFEKQEQFKIFCQFVQKYVLNKHGMLTGQLVFQFLIDKLKQCEKLDRQSNSAIERLDKQQSQLKLSSNMLGKGKKHSSTSQRKQKLFNDYDDSNLQRFDLENLSHKNLQLLLNSTIKKTISVTKSPFNDPQNGQNVRYSISSLKDLSELIQGETACVTKQNRFGIIKQDQTSDITMK